MSHISPCCFLCWLLKQQSVSVNLYFCVLLSSECGADSSIPQGGEIFAEEDSIPSLETLRTYSGGQLHGPVGREYDNYTA